MVSKKKRIVMKYAYVNEGLIGEPHGSAIGIEVYGENGEERSFFFRNALEEAEAECLEINELIEAIKPKDPISFAVLMAEGRDSYLLKKGEESEVLTRGELKKKAHSLLPNAEKVGIKMEITTVKSAMDFLLIVMGYRVLVRKE
jgi:hypothetical protein